MEKLGQKFIELSKIILLSVLYVLKAVKSFSISTTFINTASLGISLKLSTT